MTTAQFDERLNGLWIERGLCAKALTHRREQFSCQVQESCAAASEDLNKDSALCYASSRLV